VHVVKGHGTENDFVLLPDLDGVIDLTAELTRQLCERRAGVGADGVLRVVRSANDDTARSMAEQAPYFMDYRNADGSIAEMCGNGVRVFARYLQRERLISDQTVVGTRGGPRRVWLDGSGDVTVDMGVPAFPDMQPRVTTGPLHGIRGTAVEVPNPHVVVSVPTVEDLRALDLSLPPQVDPARPDGQNVEFVVRLDARHLSMRVHERGVGETRSCGTGICAAVVAVAVAGGATGGDGSTWRVDVPGGVCRVTWQPSGQVLLSGPAVIVGDIELDDRWLRPAREVADGAR
jgi:diaminopimelate epimerase